MSAIEETKSEIGVAKPPAAAARKGPSVVTQVLNLLSSVRLGVTLLCVLVVFSMAGMLIMQQNVDGFDKYYATLTPAQQFLYGKLLLFDVYHAWYFNALLMLLSLNIVLASIDRFPTAWSYISRKKLTATEAWLKGQLQDQTFEGTLRAESRADVLKRIADAFRSVGMRARVTDKDGVSFVFGERGTWNRLGAYAVHVALLTIFFGGFLTAQFGRTGTMPLAPGEKSNEMTETVFNLDQLGRQTTSLTFTVECTDIQQKLSRKEGPITPDNTLDWLTHIKITDPIGCTPGNPGCSQTEALVHMNRPFDYRGYRFFQASFVQPGSARQVTLRLTPAAGGQPLDVAVRRGAETTLADGTRVKYENFFPDFAMNGARPDTKSEDYNNPAALLSVTPPNGQPERAYAFQAELPESAPIGRPVAGYKFRLADFEKVASAHVLSVQRDPGATIVYIGFALLGLTLAAVFFFSHQRVWARVDDGGAGGEFRVVLGGNTNRNKLGFGDRFRRVVRALGGQPIEVKES